MKYVQDASSCRWVTVSIKCFCRTLWCVSEAWTFDLFGYKMSSHHHFFSLPDIPMKYHRNQHMNYSVMATAVMCEVTVTFDHQNLIRSLSSRWRFSHFWRTIPWRRAGDIELTDWSIQPLSSITLLPLLVSSLVSFSETRTFPWRRTPDFLATCSCCIKFRTSQLFLLFFFVLTALEGSMKNFSAPGGFRAGI